MAVARNVAAIRKWLSRMADSIQPLIIASNAAGLAGGAIAAAGLLTTKALQSRLGGNA